LQRRLGFTAVYVTHDQAEAMAIADRIAIMEKGSLRQVGTRATSTSAPPTPSSPASWERPTCCRQGRGEGRRRRAGPHAFGGRSARRAADGVGPGDAVWVSIRPEAMQIRAGPSGRRQHLAGDHPHRHLRRRIDHLPRGARRTECRAARAAERELPGRRRRDAWPPIPAGASCYANKEEDNMRALIAGAVLAAFAATAAAQDAKLIKEAAATKGGEIIVQSALFESLATQITKAFNEKYAK